MININEYQQREYNNKIKLLNELNDLGGVYRFELLENKQEPGRSEIVLTGLIPVYVNYIEYQKKYGFYLRHNLLYVKYDSEKRIKEQLAEIKEPQNVGVLTANKIKAWVEYLIKVYEEMVAVSAERTAKVAEFRAEVEAQGARISDHKHEFAPKDGTFSGEIVKNGIEFKFQVHDEGYISKEIEIHYTVGDSLENFLALADNKYIKPQD